MAPMNGAAGHLAPYFVTQGDILQCCGMLKWVLLISEWILDALLQQSISEITARNGLT